MENKLSVERKEEKLANCLNIRETPSEDLLKLLDELLANVPHQRIFSLNEGHTKLAFF